MGARTTSCLDCGTAVSLIDGVAVVRAGVVGVVCRVCPEAVVVTVAGTGAEAAAAIEIEDDDEPELTPEPMLATAHAVPAPARGSRSPVMRALPLVAVTAVIALTGYLSHAEPTPEASTLEISPDDAAPRLAHVSITPSEPPPVHALTYSLTDEQAELPWVHPIAGDVRELPDKDDRRFGAERPGNRPSECGGGHCGVDLGETRGTVIHAALGGRIIRIKADAGGASGRYVAIEHPQGLRSSYMHLDAVNPDLVVGVDVASGEAIGTLGRSGIHHSPAHLHFTVERKTDSGWQYVDPEPMLTQATVLETPAPMPMSNLDLSVKLPVPPAPPHKAAFEDRDE